MNTRGRDHKREKEVVYNHGTNAGDGLFSEEVVQKIADFLYRQALARKSYTHYEYIRLFIAALELAGYTPHQVLLQAAFNALYITTYVKRVGVAISPVPLARMLGLFTFNLHMGRAGMEKRTRTRLQLIEGMLLGRVWVAGADKNRVFFESEAGERWTLKRHSGALYYHAPLQNSRK